jgi:hypothetical protein
MDSRTTGSCRRNDEHRRRSHHRRTGSSRAFGRMQEDGCSASTRRAAALVPLASGESGGEGNRPCQREGSHFHLVPPSFEAWVAGRTKHRMRPVRGGGGPAREPRGRGRGCRARRCSDGVNLIGRPSSWARRVGHRGSESSRTRDCFCAVVVALALLSGPVQGDPAHVNHRLDIAALAGEHHLHVGPEEMLLVPWGWGLALVRPYLSCFLRNVLLSAS